MGRKLLMVSGSSPGFLRMGVTAASLSVSGIEPELREELIIAMMSGAMAGRQSLTRVDGMGSRIQVELLIPVVKEESSDGGIGENLERG